MTVSNKHCFTFTLDTNIKLGFSGFEVGIPFIKKLFMKSFKYTTYKEF